MADPSSDARDAVAASATNAADAAAAAAYVVEDARAELRAVVSEFATQLFDQLMAGAERKGEPPEKAAKKITKIVAARAEREAAAQAADAPQDPPPPPPEPEIQGNVTGKTSGVNRKLLTVLRAVSAHYDETIRIVSGKRDARAVATAIFMAWNGHLRQGKAMPYFRSNEKVRAKLDGLKQDKNRSGFETHLLDNADTDALSPHMTGDAVDLPNDTPDPIVEALATCLNHKAEKNTEGKRVHHFDLDKLVWPIPDSVRDRWPEAE